MEVFILAIIMFDGIRFDSLDSILNLTALFFINEFDDLMNFGPDVIFSEAGKLLLKSTFDSLEWEQ